MARIPHRKSRLGCATCKKRHVKCDEKKPSCSNCTIASRKCPYLDEQTRPSTVNSPLSIGLPGGITSDLLYVNALNQWCKHTQQIYCSPDNPENPGTIMLDIAIKHPFLLHGLLALSSFHLAIEDSALHDAYLAHSHELLAQGMEGFNAAVSAAGGLNEGNIMAALVFSNVAGLCKFAHLFSTMHESVDTFIDNFIETVTLLRGVAIVVGPWWPVITESTLYKRLNFKQESARSSMEQETTERQELPKLRDLIKLANFDDETTESCVQVIAQLEDMYNIRRNTNSRSDSKPDFPEAVWFIRFPAAFHALLLSKTPEALIIIAYVAPLIHYRRSYWLVRNSGEVLMNGVSDFLGSTWSSWLEDPQKLIEEDE